MSLPHNPPGYFTVILVVVCAEGVVLESNLRIVTVACKLAVAAALAVTM